MKVFLIVLLALASSDVENEKNPDCRDFKTGKFKLIDGTGQYIIERSDSIHSERNLITGESSKYKVSWINDCQFELRIIEGRKDIMDFYHEKVLVIKIIETNLNGYKCIGQIKGDKKKYRNTLERLVE